MSRFTFPFRKKVLEAEVPKDFPVRAAKHVSNPPPFTRDFLLVFSNYDLRETVPERMYENDRYPVQLLFAKPEPDGVPSVRREPEPEPIAFAPDADDTAWVDAEGAFVREGREDVRPGLVVVQEGKVERLMPFLVELPDVPEVTVSPVLVGHGDDASSGVGHAPAFDVVSFYHPVWNSGIESFVCHGIWN